MIFLLHLQGGSGGASGPLKATAPAGLGGWGRLEHEPIALRATAAAGTVGVARLTSPEGAMTAAHLRLHLRHLRHDAPGSDRVLDALCVAFAAPLARHHMVSHGTDRADPWGVLRNPAVAPLWALPVAALSVGGSMPPRLDGESDDAYEARARLAITYPRGMRRGGVEAVRQAVATTLTGSRAVTVHERPGGSPWALHITTVPAETPDPVATRREAERYAPAGVVVTVNTTSVQTYLDVRAKHATYTATRAAYATYAAARAAAP